MSITLHPGDALTILPTLPADSFDLVLTDPPYSSGGLHIGTRQQAPTAKYAFHGGHRAHDFAGENMDQRSWRHWCLTWLNECHRVLKPGHVIAVFIDWRQLPTLTDALQMAGFSWQGVAVWDKTTSGCRPRRNGMKQQAEFIVWGSKGTLRQDADVYLPGVFQARRSKQDWHATSKPLPVVEQILALAGPAGSVLDPFAGGATVLKAAASQGLQAVGCEKVPAIHHRAAQDLHG